MPAPDTWLIYTSLYCDIGRLSRCVVELPGGWTAMPIATDSPKTLCCSFCGQDVEQVRFLSAGVAGGMICDVCCLKAGLIFVKAQFRRVFRFRAAV